MAAMMVFLLWCLYVILMRCGGDDETWKNGSVDKKMVEVIEFHGCNDGFRDV